MKAILLIDHGSTRVEANNMLACMAALVQHLAGDEAIVRFAHMELAEPTIEEGFDACMAAGATTVTVFPYMLSPGRHSTTDIPRMVAAAAARYPGVAATVTPAFGVHEKLAEVILERAGLAARRGAPATCWDPAGCPGACGEACRGPVPGRGAVDAAPRRAEAIHGA